MRFKHGDTVEVEGYLGEVIKVTESYIEVSYGGEAFASINKGETM